MTLWAKAPATPMLIALAGLLEPGPLLDQLGRPRLDELRAAIEARLARAPELRRRIRRTGFGQGRPVVVTASGLASGRVGVLVVMHHALADGIVRAATAVRAAARDAAATRAAVAQLAPASSLQRPNGPTRRLAVVRRPLREVKKAGHAHGATVNDVLLAAVAFGLHRLLARRGDPMDGLELRVSVPVGAPGGARNADGSTPMVLSLPVGDLGDPDRLARIAAITGAARERRDRGYRGLLASPVAGRRPPPHRGADRAAGGRRPPGRGRAVLCRRAGHLNPGGRRRRRPGGARQRHQRRARPAGAHGTAASAISRASSASP